jgi:hypothetical protein
VITILAVLAALGTVGVLRALETAKQSRMKVEVDNMDAALKAFKERYGSYPPCDLYLVSGAMPGQLGYNAPLRQFVARAFPRYDMGTNAANLIADLNAADLDLSSTRPDQALIFWLNGFSPDPANPFITWDRKQITNGTAGTTKVSTPPFFEFDQTRLKNINISSVMSTYPSYMPAGLKQDIPYVYIDSSKYGMLSTPYYWDGNGSTVATTNAGYVTPYIHDVNQNSTLDVGTENFVNLESYQVIACGLDEKYGNATGASQRLYPTGLAYGPADDDNVTNFCTKSRLIDAKEN